MADRDATREYNTTMLDEDTRQKLAQPIRTSQIIVGALGMGALTFLIVVTLLPATGIGPADASQHQPLLTYVSAVWAIVAIGLRFGLVAMVSGKQCRDLAAGKPARATTFSRGSGQMAGLAEAGDAGRLFSTFLTVTILGCAVLEGAALLAVVAFLVERQFLAQAVAVVMIVMTLLHFPTAGRVHQWIVDHLEMVNRMRAAH